MAYDGANCLEGLIAICRGQNTGLTQIYCWPTRGAWPILDVTQKTKCHGETSSAHQEQGGWLKTMLSPYSLIPSHLTAND